DRGCFLVAGEGVGGVAEVVALEEVEGRRVEAVNIGVVVEATAGAEGHPEAHRLEGGEVKALFVDMQHLGSQAAQSAAESGVEVEVVAAVEGDRQRLELVAGGVAPLQLQRAHARLAPAFR